MTQYEVTAHESIMDAQDGVATTFPWGQTATAVLGDGTILVACRIFSGSFGTLASLGVRLWKLSPTLVVLGTADIAPIGVISDGSMMAVATSNATVLLLMNAWGASGNQVRTWVIDCSTATPVVANTTTNPVSGPNASYYGDRTQVARTAFIPSTGTTLVAFSGSDNPALQSFDTTGALTGALDLRPDGYGRVEGLHVDPADPTGCIVVYEEAGTSGSGFGIGRLFTVAGVGSTMTLVSDVVFKPGTSNENMENNHWGVGAGSPYSGGSLIVDDRGVPFPDTTALDWGSDWSFSYATGARIALGPSAAHLYEGWGYYGAALGKRLISLGGLGTQTPEIDYYQSSFFRFVGVDFATTPPALEEHLLPLTGVPFFVDVNQVVNGGAGGALGADAVSGRISAAIVITALDDFGGVWTHHLLVWSIQGPAMQPNLTGQVLDSRVRFYRPETRNIRP